MFFKPLTTEDKIALQKAVATDVLNKLYSIDPNAICAGGAPRDWYFGKPATDIDIFFYSQYGMGLVEAMLKNVGLEVLGYADGENLPEWYKLNPDLHCVFNLCVQGESVQLMLMYKPTFGSVIPNFPFSICKAWYKNGEISLDREFRRSVKHKVLVKTGELYSDAHAYVKKIKAKFPEYVYFTDWKRAGEWVMDKETF